MIHAGSHAEHSGLGPNSLVIANLVNPSEKFWGVLFHLDSAGIVLRGISVDAFDQWMRQVASDSTPTLDLVTMFVPLFRVERIFLDEQVGEVESYCQRFARQVGIAPQEYLGLIRLDASEAPS